MHEALFVPIALFLSAAAVWIVWLTLRHRERIAMLEKGLSAEDIRSLYVKEVKRDPLRSLKWGILAVFAGAAFLTGVLMEEFFNFDHDGVTVGIVIILIGAGLLLYYKIATKKLKEKE
jgi:hypothetical protein